MQGLDDKEMVQRQKLLLNRKLGLDGPVSADGLELFDEADFVVQATKETSSKPSVSVSLHIMKMCLFLFLVAYYGISNIQICRGRSLEKVHQCRQASISVHYPSNPIRAKFTENYLTYSVERRLDITVCFLLQGKASQRDS